MQLPTYDDVLAAAARLEGHAHRTPVLRSATADARWGAEPFRVGLWVGLRTTPNTTESALDAVRARRGRLGPSFGGGHPLQLTSCPWCGSGRACSGSNAASRSLNSK